MAQIKPVHLTHAQRIPAYSLACSAHGTLSVIRCLPYRRSVICTVADPGGMRGIRPHPPQLGQKFFERLYFGHYGETADQIRMPFGIIGRTGPGMRQVVGFGDRST